jgi:ABC-2 type transport system ATP-binding protein
VQLGTFVMTNISFWVTPGEIVGYLGHNGSGKTTTLRVMSNMVRPTAGTIRIGDLDHRADERAFKQRVSVVNDYHNAYQNLTVKEVLAFAAHFQPGWDERWCVQVCKGLRLPLEAKIRTLSKGMHTKLGIVMGLSPRPQFLVLDEPTAGMDQMSSEWIWAVIRAWVDRGDLGVLVASHSLSEIVDQCSRVVLLEQGHIADQFYLEGSEDKVADLAIVLKEATDA